MSPPQLLFVTSTDVGHRMSEDEDDVDEKVGPTVRYLQKLGADHLDLIFESSRWIFSVDPITALDVRRPPIARDLATDERNRSSSPTLKKSSRSLDMRR